MTTQDNKPTCSTCQFWKPDTEVEGEGSCHRYPPQVIYNGNDSRFPMAYCDDWCGEHPEIAIAPKVAFYQALSKEASRS